MPKISINLINRYIVITFPMIWAIGPAIQDIAVSFVATYFIFFLITEKKFEFFNEKVSWILIAFFISIIISSVFSPNIEISLYKSLAYVRYLLFYFAINYLIKFSSNDLKKFLILNISFLFFLSFDIWFQELKGVDLFGFKSGMDGMRNSGFFGDELIAGGFIVKVFFLTLIFFLIAKLKKIYFFLFYLFIFITVFLTGERMSLLLFIIGSFLFVLIYSDFIKHKLLIFVLILSSILILLTLNYQVRYRIIDQTYNQIFYGHSNKFHKYFNIILSNIYSIDEIKNEKKYSLLIREKNQDHSDLKLGQKVKKLINFVNQKENLKVTDINFDSYVINNLYYEIINLQIEYVRGKTISNIRKELEEITSNLEFKNLENLRLGIMNPKKFNLENTIPLIDTGWGAHFLAAKNIWLDKPLFGNGLKSFRLLCGNDKFKTISKQDKNRCSTHPHNFYFELLAETGLIGFLIIIFFFIEVIKKSIIVKNKTEIYLVIVFILTIWPIGTSGSLFNNHNAGLFWFIISMVNYSLSKKELFSKVNN